MTNLTKTVIAALLLFPFLHAPWITSFAATPPAQALHTDLTGQFKDRNSAYGAELERYFRDYLVDQYPKRAAAA